jgi:outer membrane receptor for ferrienterochelin and colicins
MRNRARRLSGWALVPLVVLAGVVSAWAQATGRIEGRLTLENGSPVGGVVVTLGGTGLVAVSSSGGHFAFDAVPPGTYTVTFTLSEDQADVHEGVVVSPGQTTRIDNVLDWKISMAETVTVHGASRREERLVEAPAAVTVVTEREIEKAAATGQLPALVAAAPGVDFTQSGVFDFNFNTRGFNSSLNRRVLTLIDGRDPAIGFLGAQEWAALSFPLDELDSVELVRGPGSALYGANAFNGVLSMYSKEPRLSQGGKLRLTGGELGTARADLRYAGALGNEWYWRATAGYMQSGDFTRSRVCPSLVTLAACQNAIPPFDNLFEYQGIPGERVPLAREDDNEIRYGALRVDKYLHGGQAFTVEGGTAEVQGPTFLTGIGRVQVLDASRPWARFNYNARHWNALAWYTGRDTKDPQLSLRSGGELWENSYTAALELQGHLDLLQERLRLVGGVSRRHQDIDTANPEGRQTLMDRARENDMDAVFGQAELALTDTVKLVAAARYDTSDLHDSQFSPKGAVVWQVRPNQTVRLTYNEAFQAPNYSEWFLRADVAAPVNLAGIQAALDATGFCSNNPTQFCPLGGPDVCGAGNTCLPLNPGGVSLGFGTPAAPVPTRVMALGNEDLEVEEIRGWELGYSAILGRRVFLSADYYSNRVENFVTDLLPLVNPNFGPYAPPSDLSPLAQAFVVGALNASLPPSARAILSNFPDGSPVFAAASYTNAGEVDTQGVELGVSWTPIERWTIDVNYSWFDFEVKSQQVGDKLLPNAPENKFNVGLGWRGDRTDISGTVRWVDDFDWASGVFAGRVPSYTVVDLSGSYALRKNVTLGVTATNVLDDEHYEIFGGDLLQRRALGYVTWTF